MTSDRDRLKELLDDLGVIVNVPDNVDDGCGTYTVEGGEYVADYLLANGVIVPPCKVGDKVYYIHETYWDKDYKKYIRTKSLKQNILQILERPDDKLNLMLEVISFDYSNINDWLNGQIFLTKEGAEQALKERNNR